MQYISYDKMSEEEILRSLETLEDDNNIVLIIDAYGNAVVADNPDEADHPKDVKNT